MSMLNSQKKYWFFLVVVIISSILIMRSQIILGAGLALFGALILYRCHLAKEFICSKFVLHYAISIGISIAIYFGRKFQFSYTDLILVLWVVHALFYYNKLDRLAKKTQG